MTRRWMLLGMFAALGMTTLALGGEEPSRPGPADPGCDTQRPPAVLGKAHPSAVGYSPYADRAYPTRLLWGDTHLHTANSGDAFMAGDRLDPDAAYRYARGEAVTSATGLRAQLLRPLDWLVVSDHAEGLGMMAQVLDGNEQLMADATLAAWHDAMKAGGEEAARTMGEVISAQAQGTLPGPLQDPKVSGPIMKSVWQDFLETAEKHNEPGRFTALLGYEWTSVPGGNNLHRNVIFRDGLDRVGQIMPFSSWQSEDPEKLWAFMAGYEEKTGGRCLAIPHNGNLSNGQMFALADMEGKPLTADYAKRRARWEPLHEIAQTKGASETHPLISPTDEFADFGIAGWDNGNLTLEGEPETPAMMPFEHMRPALKNGLALERTLGTNPFKIGMIGGTDVHNSISAVDEDNFFGKHVIQEPSPERWEHVSKKGVGSTRYGWHYLAASRAAVWARANTREAIWDALARKEVYATSGPRITLRFFGGWTFAEDDLDSRYVAGTGYAKGVPMGGDLPSPGGDATAPSFLIAAMKDPIGANLDRVQVVKGWLDAEGGTHEKIYDVAWGDAETRRPGADGALPPVGDTVNVTDATWTNTIGDPDLMVVWSDPDFDATQPSFYYVRVLEIPTPRWTAYDAKRFGLELPPTVPLKHQERAWSSPIWYTP